MVHNMKKEQTTTLSLKFHSLSHTHTIQSYLFSIEQTRSILNENISACFKYELIRLSTLGVGLGSKSLSESIAGDSTGSRKLKCTFQNRYH